MSNKFTFLLIVNFCFVGLHGTNSKSCREICENSTIGGTQPQLEVDDNLHSLLPALPDEFATVCRRSTNTADVLKKYSKCFDACPSSKDKSNHRVSKKLFDFVCVEQYEEFQKHLKCLQGTADISNQCCFKTLCNNKKDHIGTVPSLVVANKCRKTRCLLNCSSNLVDDNCGAEAAKLREVFAAVLIRAVDEQTSIEHLDYSTPDECKSFFSPSN